MQIKYVPAFKDNYIWLIMDDHHNKVIAVDPGDAQPLLDYLRSQQLDLEAILITHHHADHTGGIAALTEKHPIRVFGPPVQGVTDRVKEPDVIEFPFLNTSFKVLDIPGHTLDHIAFLLPGILFCGDTLFSAGCGRVFEGTFEQMYQSLQKIVALPDDTKIYCAHEYTLQNLKFAQVVEPGNTKILDKIKQSIALMKRDQPTLPTFIRDEKEINPFLRCHVKEVIESVQNHVGLKFNHPLEVFQHLREWKNHFN